MDFFLHISSSLSPQGCWWFGLQVVWGRLQTWQHWWYWSVCLYWGGLCLCEAGCRHVSADDIDLSVCTEVSSVCVRQAVDMSVLMILICLFVLRRPLPLVLTGPSGSGVHLENGRSRVWFPLAVGFFWVESYQWLKKLGTPVATLPGAWHYRIRAGTGWLGVSILWLGEIAWSATSISVWQHIHLSEQTRAWDTLACCWDIKRASNQQRNSCQAVDEAYPLAMPSCCSRPEARRWWSRLLL